MAVFKLDLRRAMQALQDGAAAAKNAGRGEMADILSVVRVALSGYSSEGSGLWRETVAASLSSLPDPALRAVFSFLTCPIFLSFIFIQRTPQAEFKIYVVF